MIAINISILVLLIVNLCKGSQYKRAKLCIDVLSGTKAVHLDVLSMDALPALYTFMATGPVV